MKNSSNLPQHHLISVELGDRVIQLSAPHGANLRQLLLDHGISPYAALTRRANCGGRGLCATCGVWIDAGEPAPTHWHDRAAAAFGYPRLSCQITVEGPMTVRLVPGKRIWGGRDPQRRFRRG